MPLSRRHVMTCIAGLSVTRPAWAANSVADEVVTAEKAFDAYTAVHGFARGFVTFSTPDAIGFNPAPFPMHKQLADDLAKTPSPPEEPSKLHWWPHRVGMSNAGDLGFDLGGWRIEGQAGGGWFFTIWQKQADGSWLWALDVGAGRTADAALLPAQDKLIIDPLPANVPSGNQTFFEGVDFLLNTRIDAEGPVKPVISSLGPTGLVCAAEAIPAATQTDQIKRLSARPSDGYITLGCLSSTSGDLACCYGHVLDKDDKPAGYYVRLWRREQAGKSLPRLVVDIYHPAAPAKTA